MRHSICWDILPVRMLNMSFKSATVCLMWQDYVISACIIAFIIALFPMIVGPDKPALKSSVMTAGIQIVLTVTYVTLDLWFSVVTGAILFGCWATLAVQKWSMRPKRGWDGLLEAHGNSPRTTVP